MYVYLVKDGSKPEYLVELGAGLVKGEPDASIKEEFHNAFSIDIVYCRSNVPSEQARKKVVDKEPR